jgi:hypothetical protein
MQRVARLLFFSLLAKWASAQTFSPPAGTYSSAQSVAISCPGGKTAFYRTDGKQPVTIASTKYTGPITVSTTQTIATLCATLGAYQGNLQASSIGSACHTANNGTWGPLTCTASGGVGTVNPSNATWTFGSTSAETVTAPAGTGSEVQILYTWLFGGNADPSAPTCDSCTEQVQDIVIQPTAGSSDIANHEMDMPQFDFTHSINRQNGLQCNQQTGTLQWQVDSGNAGGWTNTTIPCNLAANSIYEIVNSVSHVIGDTGCGGQGCAHYNWLWVNGVLHTLGGTYLNTQGYNAQSGGKAWGRQDQIDLKPTGASPVTGGRNILSATVALGFGDETAVTSATYTIGSGPPPPGPPGGWNLSGAARRSGAAH